MPQNITVFCGSHKGRTPIYESSIALLGKLIAQQHRTLIYGGSNKGYMGTLSSAAIEEGGHVVAVIPRIFSNEVIYSQQVGELIIVDTMLQRKEILIERGDAFIALPGGVGTLDEFTDVLSAKQLGTINKPLALLNIEGFFDSFLSQLQHCVDEGLMEQRLLDSIVVHHDPEVVLQRLQEDQQPTPTL